MRHNILIYANKVAQSSETFIYHPALKMQRYKPYFVGSRRGAAIDVDDERVIIANGGGRQARIKQRLFTMLFGHNGVPFLAKRLQKLNPRLIQAHFGPESINVIPLAEKLSVPLIVYYHGFDATATKEYSATVNYLQRHIDKLPLLHEKATLVLTQSDFLRERVLALGYPPHKVRTHYIGVEPPTQAPIPRSQRKPIVLFLARLVEKKGATYLIDAMRIVQQQFPELELVIAGDGIQYDELHQQAKAQLKNFRFVGWQSHQDVYEWMQRALVFSVPSITAENGDSEGFGMVFIEAQRVGTPVVSTLHGGIVESVKHNETGLLVPERSSQQLADAIIRLYKDEQLWNEFSVAGYERVKREFDINMLVAKLEEIYDELCSNWRKS